MVTPCDQIIRLKTRSYAKPLPTIGQHRCATRSYAWRFWFEWRITIFYDIISLLILYDWMVCVIRQLDHTAIQLFLGEGCVPYMLHL